MITLAGLHRCNEPQKRPSVWSGTCQPSAAPLPTFACSGITLQTDTHFSRQRSRGEITVLWVHLKEPGCLLFDGRDIYDSCATRCGGVGAGGNHRQVGHLLAAQLGAGRGGRGFFGTRVPYQLHAHAGDSNYPCEKQASLATSLPPCVHSPGDNYTHRVAKRRHCHYFFLIGPALPPLQVWH